MEREDLVHLCNLCRLRCSSHKLDMLTRDLGVVLDYVKCLDKLEEGEKCSSELYAANNLVRLDCTGKMLREDVPTHSLPRNEFLQNTCSTAGMVVVPRVI